VLWFQPKEKYLIYWQTTAATPLPPRHCRHTTAATPLPPRHCRQATKPPSHCRQTPNFLDVTSLALPEKPLAAYI